MLFKGLTSFSPFLVQLNLYQLTLRSIVCILPFPALLKVTERRLRVAICGVFSIAFVALIVSIVRVTLLATNANNSIQKIMILSTIEMTASIVIGILPGLSSSFTRRYVQAGTETPKSSSRSKIGRSRRQTFTQLSAHRIPGVKDVVDTSSMELRELGHAYGFAEAGASSKSLTGSTDQIIGPSKEGISITSQVTIVHGS